MKIIKTRKPHKCCACEAIIPKGTYCNFHKERQPRFDKDDNQIGIEYINIWVHLPPKENETDCIDENI